jgi:hypothetical protein
MAGLVEQLAQGIRVSDAIEWARAILDRYDTVGPGAPPTMLTDKP